jgi:hypothetical protein
MPSADAQCGLRGAKLPQGSIKISPVDPSQGEQPSLLGAFRVAAALLGKVPSSSLLYAFNIVAPPVAQGEVSDAKAFGEA